MGGTPANKATIPVHLRGRRLGDATRLLARPQEVRRSRRTRKASRKIAHAQGQRNGAEVRRNPRIGLNPPYRAQT